MGRDELTTRIRSANDELRAACERGDERWIDDIRCTLRALTDDLHVEDSRRQAEAERAIARWNLAIERANAARLSQPLYAAPVYDCRRAGA